LTTFNLSDESISHSSFSDSLHSEDFTSKVQWYMNSLHHSEKMKTRQEVIDKIQQNFSQLKLRKNNEYVQWTLNTGNSFLQNLRIIIKFFSLHSNSSHLMSFFLTLQNSLLVSILLNYSNFNDTIALFKCMIKRIMLILTDNFHSVQWFRNKFFVEINSSHLMNYWISSYFTKFSTSFYFIELFKFQWYYCITQMHHQENNADFNR